MVTVDYDRRLARGWLAVKLGGWERMTPERWRQIGEMFEAALQTDPVGREAWLRTACGGDDELRIEVGRLLALHERVNQSGFVTPPQQRLRPRIGRRAGALWRSPLAIAEAVR